MKRRFPLPFEKRYPTARLQIILRATKFHSRDILVHGYPDQYDPVTGIATGDYEINEREFVDASQAQSLRQMESEALRLTNSLTDTEEIPILSLDDVLAEEWDDEPETEET